MDWIKKKLMWSWLQLFLNFLKLRRRSASRRKGCNSSCCWVTTVWVQAWCRPAVCLWSGRSTVRWPRRSSCHLRDVLFLQSLKTWTAQPFVSVSRIQHVQKNEELPVSFSSRSFSSFPRSVFVLGLVRPLHAHNTWFCFSQTLKLLKHTTRG